MHSAARDYAGVFFLKAFHSDSPLTKNIPKKLVHFSYIHEELKCNCNLVSTLARRRRRMFYLYIYLFNINNIKYVIIVTS